MKYFFFIVSFYEIILLDRIFSTPYTDNAMSKPRRTKEILAYLVKNHTSGKNVYSQRVIAATLGASQPTVQKTSRALEDYLSYEGHSVDDFKDKDESELDRMLALGSRSDKILSDNDYEQILRLLENPDRNASNVLESLQTALKTDNTDKQDDNCAEEDAITSRLTKEGRNFLRECNYATFVSNLHRFCVRKDYSDRLEFKPAEYLEIGVLPYKAPKNSSTETDQPQKDKQSLKDMGRFLFYAYLPFSRNISVTIIDTHDTYFSNQIITALILFLYPMRGLPVKIIGKGRIEEVFKDAELRPLRNYFCFCNLLYSSNRKRCSFEEREQKFIETIRKSLKATKDKDEKKTLQERIDRDCMNHNDEESVKTAFARETPELRKNAYPDEYFICDLPAELKRQNNCHLKFHGHWYSCRYTCKTPLLAYEFTGDGRINLIMKQQLKDRQEIVSRHPLYSEEGDSKSSYSTNAEDLPKNDQEADENGILTRKKLLLMIGRTFNAVIDINGELTPDNNNNVIKVANAYIDSRKFPQQAYKLLEGMCRKESKDIEIIRMGCAKLLHNLNSKSFPSDFSDLIRNTYKSRIMSDKSSSLDEDEYTE